MLHLRQKAECIYLVCKIVLQRCYFNRMYNNECFFFSPSGFNTLNDNFGRDGALVLIFAHA